MSNYEALYEKRFVRNLKKYGSIRQNIKRRIERLLIDPYLNTEILSDIGDKLNLTGCRSARVDRNFRIIFVICGECREIPECEYCFCDGLPDETIIILTVGPHDKAYELK